MLSEEIRDSIHKLFKDYSREHAQEYSNTFNSYDEALGCFVTAEYGMKDSTERIELLIDDIKQACFEERNLEILTKRLADTCSSFLISSLYMSAICDRAKSFSRREDRHAKNI